MGAEEHFFRASFSMRGLDVILWLGVNGRGARERRGKRYDKERKAQKERTCLTILARVSFSPVNLARRAHGPVGADVQRQILSP